MMIFIENNYRKILFSIPLVSFLLHYQVFKLDLVGFHVWRQTKTQTVIDNFYTEGVSIFDPKVNDYKYNERSRREEFPIMQWLFAKAYSLFGKSISVSRFMSFFVGLFSVFGFYYLLLTIFKNNKSIATLGAWCFNFSPVFYYYTLNPMPDNFALSCGIWSIALFFNYIHRHNLFTLIFSAVFLCLSTLSKLPFVLYGCIMGTYVLWMLKSDFKLNIGKCALISIVFAAVLMPAVLWYSWVMPTWKGNGIVNGIFESNMDFSEILDILYFNVVILLPKGLVGYCSFPFFMAGIFFMFKNRLAKTRLFPLFFVWTIAISLYFIFEINMIAKIHDYYLFPFLPILFIVVAYGLWQTLQIKNIVAGILTLLLLVLPVFASYYFVNRLWNIKSPGFNVDYYTNKNELRALVDDHDKVVIGSDKSGFILLYYVNKKGWTFYKSIDVEKFVEWKTSGAKYLYTDIRIDTIAKINEHLGEKIYDKGSVRVYKIADLEK